MNFKFFSLKTKLFFFLLSTPLKIDQGCILEHQSSQTTEQVFYRKAKFLKLKQINFKLRCHLYKMQYKKVPIQEDCSLVTTNISQNTMCSSSACCFIEWRRITIVLFFLLFGYAICQDISSLIESVPGLNPGPGSESVGNWATRDLHGHFFIYTVLFPPAL